MRMKQISIYSNKEYAESMQANSIIVISCGLHILASSAVWFKANAKDVFGIDKSPLFWWVSIGLIIEYCYLNAWWKLSEDLGPWKAMVLLQIVGSCVGIVWMSIFYGFKFKFILSIALLVLAALVTRLDI